MEIADLTKLESAFVSIGDVENMQFEVDSVSKRNFGIFEMKTEQQAADCIECFNGQKVANRLLSVSAQRPKFRTK